MADNLVKVVTVFAFVQNVLKQRLPLIYLDYRLGKEFVVYLNNSPSLHRGQDRLGFVYDNFVVFDNVGLPVAELPLNLVHINNSLHP